MDTCRIHTPECARDDTCECHPALAAPGSLVCGHHADTPRWQLRELPALWADLGSKPSGGNGGGGSSEPPLPMSDRARLERQGMRMMLVVWAKVLEEERGSPLPDERKIARRTRAEIVRHQADRDIAMTAWRNHRLIGDPVYGIPDRMRLLKTANEASERAERCMEARATDADIIEALREHIDRHLAWLLNREEHADQLVHDVDSVYRTAVRTAYPSRATIRILCACGRRVAISTDKDAVMTCPGCGEWGTLSWWQTMLAPPASGLLTAADAVGWLVLHHRLDIGVGKSGEARIRQWATRFPDEIERKGKDINGRTLYDAEQILAVAQRMNIPTVTIPGLGSHAHR